jgi:hypothetical protein
MKMAVFWVVAPCDLVEVYRRFRGASCLHYQGDRSSNWFISQSPDVLILITAVNMVILVNFGLVGLVIESIKRSSHLNIQPTVHGEIC